MKNIHELLRFDGTLPDPGDTPGVKSKGAAAKAIKAMTPELGELQEKLFANGKLDSNKRLLLVLQGMDASGKDGTVKHVVGLLNPGGCRITSFGKPSKEELAHDFLWRTTNALPTAGEVGVFNRSHYEDVLIVRVHDLVPPAVWGRRYGRINTWEKRQAARGCTIVKVFLHISKAEQKERLLARIDDPTKHWKVGTADIPERHRWDDYQEAYRDVLNRCSTDVAPWHVVPSDRKWYRNWAISNLVLESLRAMDLGWPTPEGIDMRAMKKELQSETA